MPCYDAEAAEDQRRYVYKANMLCKLLQALHEKHIPIPAPFREFDRLHRARDEARKRFEALEWGNEAVKRRALREVGIAQAAEDRAVTAFQREYGSK